MKLVCSAVLAVTLVFLLATSAAAQLGTAGIAGVVRDTTGAVLPGVSRVGIVITVTRTLGYERPDATRFALLLSIPWMLASALYSFWVGIAERAAFDDERALLTAAISGIAGFLAIAFLMYWVRRSSFTLFALYRVALGGALIYALYRAPMLVCG